MVKENVKDIEIVDVIHDGEMAIVLKKDFI